MIISVLYYSLDSYTFSINRYYWTNYPDRQYAKPRLYDISCFIVSVGMLLYRNLSHDVSLRRYR